MMKLRGRESNHQVSFDATYRPGHGNFVVHALPRSLCWVAKAMESMKLSAIRVLFACLTLSRVKPLDTHSPNGYPVNAKWRPQFRELQVLHNFLLEMVLSLKNDGLQSSSKQLDWLVGQNPAKDHRFVAPLEIIPLNQ